MPNLKFSVNFKMGLTNSENSTAVVKKTQIQNNDCREMILFKLIKSLCKLSFNPAKPFVQGYKVIFTPQT